MGITDFITQNSVYLAILLPITYFVVKDLYTAYRERKNLEKHKKAMIESERRIFELIKQSDKNKVDLINKLSSLKDTIDGSISEIDKESDDKEKKD